MGAFPWSASEVVGAGNFCAGMLFCEPDCGGPTGHARILDVRGDAVGAVRRGNSTRMVGCDVWGWAGEGSRCGAQGDSDSGEEGRE